MSTDPLSLFEQFCYHSGCSLRHAVKAGEALLACELVIPAAIIITLGALIFFY